MKRLLILALSFALTGCAVTPGCYIVLQIPTFVPYVGCGLDFGPRDEDDDLEEDDDA